MNALQITRYWMLGIGAVLVLIGLLGFVDNPIVGEGDAIFHAGVVHHVIHIVTGVIALAVGGALRGASLAYGTIGFGALYALVLVGTVVSPDLLGILEVPVNEADHVLHVILAGGSLALGAWSWSEINASARAR
jgi:hypothetical protein